MGATNHGTDHGLDHIGMEHRQTSPILGSCFSDSQLELLAKMQIDKFGGAIDGNGLQVHLIEERTIERNLIFYTRALLDYLNQAGGDNAQARKIGRAHV